MTRLLRVISGSDLSPTIDFTDDVDFPDSEFAGLADRGQSGVGRMRVRDIGGTLPDAMGAGRMLNSHNVVKFEDSPFRLFRGRVETKEYQRDDVRGVRPRFIDVTLSDSNADLRGLVVHSWTRPSESDKARVQALIAAYLSGSPRPSTNINGSNYVSGSNLITLEAKTYTGTTPLDVLNEIADATGKNFFVTVDEEMFYDGWEAGTYPATLRISDDPADFDGLTYPPIWDSGSALAEDGHDTFSRLRAYWGDDQTVVVANSIAPYYDYWEGLWYDDKATTSTEASQRATQKLDGQQTDIQTISCSIGPIPWEHLNKIKYGQTIQFKARAARGGRAANGTYTGDAFVALRIAELRWRPLEAELYMATIRLVRPPKIRGFGRGEEAMVRANQAISRVEETPAPFAAVSFSLDHDNLLHNSNDTGLTNWTDSPADLPAYSGVEYEIYDTDADALCGAVTQLREPYQRFAATLLTFTSVTGEPTLVRGTIEWNREDPPLGPRPIANKWMPHIVTVQTLSSGLPVSLSTLYGGAGVVSLNDTADSGSIQVTVPLHGSGATRYVLFVCRPLWRLGQSAVCGHPSDWGAIDFEVIQSGATLLEIDGPGWVELAPLGSYDGVDTVFTLSGVVAEVDYVTKNGLELPQTSFSVSGNVITFQTPPKATDLVIVRYRVE